MNGRTHAKNDKNHTELLNGRTHAKMTKTIQITVKPYQLTGM